MSDDITNTYKHAEDWAREASGYAHICRNCEFYDDGTGDRRTADSGDCLSPASPRFQTKPDLTCPRWLLDTTLALNMKPDDGDDG